MAEPARERPHLAPGLRIVRRGLEQLQVGLYAGRRAVLPRTPVVERTLAALLDQSREPDPEGAGVLAELARRGCLVEGHEHLRGVAGVVALDGDLPGVRDLLGAAGLRVRTRGTRADVVLVLAHGELDRTRLDPLVRLGTSHLVVRLVDGAAVLGPFVVPGLTACLRCVDLHRSVADPDHVPVTARYARATARPRLDGDPQATDPVLAALAGAWAVRDVVAHLTGRRPATWSRTLLLDPDPARQHEEVWASHPECGCCWSAHAPLSGTMGA